LAREDQGAPERGAVPSEPASAPHAHPHGHGHDHGHGSHEHEHAHPGHPHPHPAGGREPHDHGHGHDHDHGYPHEHGHRHGDWRHRARHAAGALGRAGWRRLLPALAAAYLLSGVYFVFADQQAVVLVFGKVRQPRVGPGMHWAPPFPLGRVERLKVLETKRLTVGVEAPDQVLGRSGGEPRSQFLTGDQNLIDIRLAVQYQIEDPVRYLYGARDVTAVLARTVESALSGVVVRRNVDDLLTLEKVAVQNEVQQRAQTVVQRFGISIASVGLESITPPDEVLEAFRDVASAREDRERIVREAEAYGNALVPKARGEAERLRQEAASYGERKVNEARGEASRFTSLAAEYRKARDVTSARLFLETMEEVLPRLRKLVIESGPGGVDLDVILKRP
jgi:membrane protease subunit HflK